MTEKRYSATEKDQMLRGAFVRLQTRGLTSAWASHPTPYSALHAECQGLMAQPAFASEMQRYLQAHSIVRRAVQMVYTCISMAARARWDNAPEHVRPLAARGWFLGRWLPTFLVIDGPIGRFLGGDTSPLNHWLGPERPLLTAARDFMNDRLFKLLRNGFAHWGFDWEVVGSESYVVAYDWERDLPTGKLHQTEADAFHIIAFALIEILDDVFISQRDDGRGTPGAA